ncbi:high-affinity choline transporter 1-like [Clavelina lepadiformis]|uniref:high-affinity choline transporter 1-like n=1 Tax=Clavelina lepadiformis TaxID=159417 RepID=UPI004041E01C
MAVNVPGLIAIIVFYLVILAVGLGAAWYQKRKGVKEDVESIMVAGRDIGVFVGCFTMTATWVGGGYINGTAEVVYNPDFGLLWTQAPFGYAISLLLGGLFFAKKMRSEGYVTMLDPLQNKLGRVMGVFLYLPALLGELFWSAAILASLGKSLTVVSGLSDDIAIIVSACIAILYTLIGGLYSVAYTDVVQLICIFVGLWISIPFAFTNEAVGSIVESAKSNSSWLGTWDTNYTGSWIDSALLLIFGGIPWQVYFQRVLSSDSAKHAQLLSFAASFGCIIMAVPSILVGAIAASTNWSNTSYQEGLISPSANNETSAILPIVLQHLTPPAVAFVGLGAVSAAVMSSADSSILSSSSMFTRNVYKKLIRRKASSKEQLIVSRVAMVIVGVIATVLAIKINSIYALWYLCSDLIYTILFPQLLCVMYFDPNTYGSIIAFVVAAILRIGGGETLINFDPFIPYPGNSPTSLNFPFKTFSMLVSLILLLTVSYFVRALFTGGFLDPRYDILKCRLASGGRSIEQKEDNVSTPNGVENVAYDNSKL